MIAERLISEHRGEFHDAGAVVLGRVLALAESDRLVGDWAHYDLPIVSVGMLTGRRLTPLQPPSRRRVFAGLRRSGGAAPPSRSNRSGGSLRCRRRCRRGSTRGT